MDEGWAAVVAGIAGLAGAGIGGYFAMRGAIAGAKASANATALQVKQQSQHEQAHWVRQERRATFGEVLRNHSELARVLLKFRATVRKSQPLDEVSPQVNEALNHLAVASGSINLLGPDDVYIAAQRLCHRARKVCAAHRSWAHQHQAGGGPRLEEAETEISDARDAMREAMVHFTQLSRRTLVGDDSS